VIPFLLRPYGTTPALDDVRSPAKGNRARFWFAASALTLIVASDFKFRVRNPNATFSGGVDSFVLIELALYACVGLYLFQRFGRRPRLRRTSAPVYFACLFVGLMVLSLAYTAYPTYAFVRVAQMCVLLGLVLVAVRNGTRGDLHQFAHFYIALIAGSVVYGVLVPSAPVTKLQAGRFTWLAIHPTVSGAMTGIATVLTIGYLIAGNRPRPGTFWPRGGYWAALALAGGGLIGTQTRGAVVGAFAGVVVIVFALSGRRSALQLGAALVGLGLVVALVAGGPIAHYFARGETVQQLSSLNSRTDFWRTALDAVEVKPMFGYGVTSARGIFYDTSGLGGGHNAVVNVLVELGIVGLLVWLALVLSLLGAIRRLPVRRVRELAVDRALLLGVVTFLLVDGIFYEGPAAVSNAACTWLFVCVAWFGVDRRYADYRESLWRSLR
jgi:O-antigen ligase